MPLGHFREKVSKKIQVIRKQKKLNKLHRDWQITWRKALNKPIESLPEISCDFDLHFDIWGLEERELEECFAIFPHGQKILQKAREIKATLPKSLNPSEDKTLLAILEQINIHTAGVLKQDPLRLDNYRIIRGDWDEYMRIFSNADPVTIDLDDSLAQIIENQLSFGAYATYFFLSEPLYRLFNDYRLVNNVLRVMVEGIYDEEPYKQEFELFKVNAQAGLDNEGLFVFIHQDSIDQRPKISN